MVMTTDYHITSVQNDRSIWPYIYYYQIMVRNPVEIMADKARLEKIASARKKVRHRSTFCLLNFENTLNNGRDISVQNDVFLNGMSLYSIISFS